MMFLKRRRGKLCIVTYIFRAIFMTHDKQMLFSQLMIVEFLTQEVMQAWNKSVSNDSY